MSDEQMNARNHANGAKTHGGVFDALPPKASFFAGVATGIMAFCTLGFLITIAGGIDLSRLGLSGSKAWGAKPPSNDSANTNANAEQNLLSNMPPITEGDHVRGDLGKAKLVMVEYSDYDCPYCKNFHPTLKNAISAYGSDVAWVYRHFPLTGIHPTAQKKAEAAECVASLGGNEAFWKYSDLLYERNGVDGVSLGIDKLAPMAKEVGVDQAKFQKCLDEGKFAQKVKDDTSGGSAAGIEGTPGTIVVTREGKTDFINGAQPDSVVKGVIDSLLQN